MKRRPRSCLLLVILPALTAGCEKPRPKDPPPVPVTAAVAERRSVPRTLQATGTVEPVATVSVQSQVTGVLQRVLFTEGQDVRAGQVLFEIDPRAYRATLEGAKAALARDLAQLATVRENARRLAELGPDYATRQQIEQAQANADALAATVRADSAAVQSARLELQYATIRSPIAGRAGSQLVRPGNLVRANEGDPLVVINQLSPILVRFALPATHLADIRRYRSETLHVRARPADGQESEGTLAFVDNAVDTATGTILLKGRFDNRNGVLWPGQFVAVTLQLDVDDGALVVPSTAVIEGQQGAYVFVVKADQTTEVRNVRVARAAGDVTVLDGGVEPGERVVTDGQLRLTAGAKVEIKEAAQGT
ncbi:MAG TPA: efflux RND transporter periplasmic adaptor subunit [Gemmatimonadales bacterium]|nr:efflux RND transporter periplasmic adaptor subunit [Gemmatimonadales bacterium]